MKIPLKKNIAFTYLIIFVIGLLMAIYYYNIRILRVKRDLVENTQEVLRISDNVLINIITLESDIRGYILTKNKTFLESYYETLPQISPNLNLLKLLTKDNPAQQVQIDTMIENRKERSKMIAQEIDAANANKLTLELKYEFITAGKRLTDMIRRRITNINNAEFLLLQQRKLATQKIIRVVDILFASIVTLLIGVLLFVYYVFQRNNKTTLALENKSYSLQLAFQYSLSLLEASRDPLFTINAEGEITDINHASEIVTDVTKDKLIGSKFVSYFTEPDKAKMGYEEVFLKGFVIDYPLTISVGKLTDVLFNGSVYKNKDGKIIGAVVVARDITEQKRIEKEFTEARLFAEIASNIAEEAKLKAESAKRIAENAVQSKQQFLSNMSHEIRTPLNAILGFTKVVLKTELDAKQREYLTAIKMSGDALIVLVNDILDLAKVDSGKMSFELSPFKMELSISAMIHLFEPKIQEKNLVLIKEYDAKIPEVLMGDSLRLHQIIINLMSNAVKFTNEGKIRIAIKMLHEDDEKVTIEFSVQDTGIGIPATKLEKIFENFQQASSGTSRLYGGTGLGLAIVKKLVESQGGTILVESKEGVGSTFQFALNFLKTNETVESESTLNALSNEHKDISVLVVEDITLNQLLMKTLLDDFGFECDIAGNGKLAIEKMRNKNYDIILMDLQMPEMNGFEATEYIRNIFKSNIPIIALTADVTTVDLAKCKAVGMNDYISKPVDERLLYNKIASYINKVKDSNESKLPLMIKHKVKLGRQINLDYLLQRTKSNPLLVIDMIEAYLEQTPPLISAMKENYNTKKWNLLYATVHKMIPSFSIMGIHANYENMAKKVQEYAKVQQESDGILELVEQIETVCIQACNELKEELIKLKNKGNG